MKLLNNSAISPFAIEIYANSKHNIKDSLGDMHPGLTKYKLFFNPDSSVTLMCDYVEEEKIQYYRLETSHEFDFVMNDFA